MAGVSANKIKNRIRSMKNTRQLTGAMEMVAASKLRRAQNQVLACRPYFTVLQAAVREIAAGSREVSSAYLAQRSGNKLLTVVMAGERGLAGGYNSNVFKLALSGMDGAKTTVLPIGKKTAEFFQARKQPLLTEGYAQAEALSVGECFTLAKELCQRYLAGEFDRITVVYTELVSALTQRPVAAQLLPLVRVDAQGVRGSVLYEPDATEVFDRIVPEYLGGMLYGALCESRASEQAARRSAMDSASQNADELVAQLSLKYNRARQAAITQQITEIVAGYQ